MKANNFFRFVVLLTFSVMIAVLSCNDVINGGGVDISGKVTDSVTNLPIDSVAVTWGDTLTVGRYVFTDSTGFYQLFVPEGGARMIYARKEGYKTQGKLQNSAEETNFNFLLQPE